MNILIVTNVFYPENFRINDLAIYLSKKGHKVSVLTQIPSYGKGVYFKNYGIFKKRYENYKNIKIYRCFSTPRGKGYLSLFFNYFTFIFGSFFTSLLLLNKKIDKIFVFQTSPITVSLPALFIKIIKKIPICMWVLDLWPESIYAGSNKNFKYLAVLILPIVKLIYKKIDLILISSKGFSKSIVTKNVSENKIHYFPQWAEDLFDIKQFNHKSIDLNLPKIPKNSFKIMFAGNIGNSQDFPSILKTAKYIKDILKINAHWIILGDGRRFKWLKNEISKLSLVDNFHLLGSKPLEYMPLYYNEADLMLITLKDEKIFSLTVPAKTQSYFASSKIIAGMINGETQRIINHSKAGFAVNSGDFKNFALIISKIFNLSDLEKIKMKDKSYEFYANNYKRKVLLDRFEDYMIKL